MKNFRLCHLMAMLRTWVLNSLGNNWTIWTKPSKSLRVPHSSLRCMGLKRKSQTSTFWWTSINSCWQEFIFFPVWPHFYHKKIYSAICNRCPFVRWKINSFRGGWCPKTKTKPWKLCLGQQCMIWRGRKSPGEVQDTGGKYKWKFKTFMTISLRKVFFFSEFGYP